MEPSMQRALVSTILHHAEDYPWRMQDIGLLGLRLDDHREYRLHVWDPTRTGLEDDPAIHDHPYDFTSWIVAGEMANVRYDEDPGGAPFTRFRYELDDEGSRTIDTVRLTGTATTFAAGSSYRQEAHELHESRQLPGTVSIIRCTFRDVTRLSVCRRSSEWISGQSRPATRDEIKSIIAKALDWF